MCHSRSPRLVAVGSSHTNRCDEYGNLTGPIIAPKEGVFTYVMPGEIQSDSSVILTWPEEIQRNWPDGWYPNYLWEVDGPQRELSRNEYFSLASRFRSNWALSMRKYLVEQGVLQESQKSEHEQMNKFIKENVPPGLWEYLLGQGSTRERLYLGPWEKTEDEIRLEGLARQYHERCDAYDQRVCSGISPRTGEPMPVYPGELGLINRHALQVRTEIMAQGRGMGFTEEQVHRAIQSYAKGGKG